MGDSGRSIGNKLLIAVQQGNLLEVEKCLSMGANIFARTNHHTVLHLAVSSDKKALVKLILDKIKKTRGSVSPYIDSKDTEGNTPLMRAAESGYVNAATALLEFGADTEAKNSKGMTALHWAAENNHKEVMKLLINKGASIDVKDNDGLTPSDYARAEKHGEIVGYLAFSVSEMLRKQGKYNDAWRSYQEALDIQEVVLAPDHLDVLMTRHNMAVTLANLGKHSAALEIYQNVFDVQKSRDVLGPDHPDTLMTRYNMAVSFSALGENNKVFSIFRELLNIERAPSSSSDPMPLTSSDIKITQNDKLRVRSNLSQEITKKVTESNMCSTTGESQDQEPEEEIFEPKFYKLETFQKSTREHLEDRTGDVFIVNGKDRGRPAWHYVLVDQCKKEKFFEQSKKGSMDVADYGKSIFSGLGENPPQKVKDIIDELYNKVRNYLCVIKEECDNIRVYHYVLIDTDKRKLFLEKLSTNSALVNKITDCCNVLYSGLGEDPPEIISDKILEEYYNMIRGEPKGIPVLVSTKKIEVVPVEYLKTVLDKNVNVCKLERNGWTSLHEAAYVGNVHVVKNLIDDGADLLVKDAVCGRTPLHIAAREGHKNAIELFLNKNINVNEADEKNWTPLHYSAWSGHFRTVKLLIYKGADIHAKESIRGKKPIHIAAERGCMSIVDLLLRYGESVDVTDKGGRTSLYYAAWRGHLNVVKNLAEKGADINAESIHGTKPIHVAALSGCNIVIQFLLDRGGNVNDSTKDNWKPLHYAAERGCLGVVKFLINKGASIDVRDNEGKTPSDYAREKGHKDVVDFLDGLK